MLSASQPPTPVSSLHSTASNHDTQTNQKMVWKQGIEVQTLMPSVYQGTLTGINQQLLKLLTAAADRLKLDLDTGS